MKFTKISHVEEILQMNVDAICVEISPDAVIRYMYNNRDNKKTGINIDELRNAYAKSVSRSYESKRYSDNIFIEACDAKRIIVSKK